MTAWARGAGLVGACAVVLVGLAVVPGRVISAETASARSAEVEKSQLVRLGIPGGQLRAVVSPLRGAELVGLEVRHNGQWIELLYRGMDFTATRGWSGRAPILWPAVGRNFLSPPGAGTGLGNGPGTEQLGWRVHGKAYPMSIHGFARDLPWRLVSRGSCEDSAFVRLALRDNAETRRHYPFGFELMTEYRVWRDSLYIHQSVRAGLKNLEPMPFSIGNHITLRIPLLAGRDPGATTVATPATEQVITDRTGRPTGQVASVNYTEPRRLDSLEPLTPISLSGYAERQASARIADPSGFAVTIEHSEQRRPAGVPVLFNLWGDVGQGYFAPEPWVGKQNSLSSGDGVLTLAPGETYRWTITVRISEGGEGAAAYPGTGVAPSCH